MSPQRTLYGTCPVDRAGFRHHRHNNDDLSDEDQAVQKTRRHCEPEPKGEFFY